MPGFITAQVSSLCPSRAWLLLAGLLAPAAWAADGQFADDAMAAWQEETQSTASPGYEVNSLVLPSLDDPLAWGTPQRPGLGSGSNATQRIDVTRWLTPDAPHQLGMSLGLNSAAPPASAFAPQGPAAPASLDLGVRWRSRLDNGRHLDVSAWAQAPRMVQAPDAMGLIWQQQPTYGTRVEVQWASSRTRGLVPEFGAIGVQLQGGSRLVLRAKKGGPMLYYRAKF